MMLLTLGKRSHIVSSHGQRTPGGRVNSDLSNLEQRGPVQAARAWGKTSPMDATSEASLSRLSLEEPREAGGSMHGAASSAGSMPPPTAAPWASRDAAGAASTSGAGIAATAAPWAGRAPAPAAVPQAAAPEPAAVGQWQPMPPPPHASGGFSQQQRPVSLTAAPWATNDGLAKRAGYAGETGCHTRPCHCGHGTAAAAAAQPAQPTPFGSLQTGRGQHRNPRAPKP